MESYLTVYTAKENESNFCHFLISWLFIIMHRSKIYNADSFFLPSTSNITFSMRKQQQVLSFGLVSPSYHVLETCMRPWTRKGTEAALSSKSVVLVLRHVASCLILCFISLITILMSISNWIMERIAFEFYHLEHFNYMKLSQFIFSFHNRLARGC